MNFFEILKSAGACFVRLFGCRNHSKRKTGPNKERPHSTVVIEYDEFGHTAIIWNGYSIRRVRSNGLKRLMAIE